MNTLYIMCGLPGAGKSTFAKNSNIPCVSMDAIRGELYGDETVQTNGRRVFNTAIERINNYFSNSSTSCIFDGTNCTPRRRKALMKRFNARFICVWIATDKDTCIKRNLERTRKVPLEVIERYAAQFKEPTLEEGFSEIWKYTTEKGYEIIN